MVFVITLQVVLTEDWKSLKWNNQPNVSPERPNACSYPRIGHFILWGILCIKTYRMKYRKKIVNMIYCHLNKSEHQHNFRSEILNRSTKQKQKKYQVQKKHDVKQSCYRNILIFQWKKSHLALLPFSLSFCMVWCIFALPNCYD